MKFNPSIIREMFLNAPARLTVSETVRLASIKHKAYAIKNGAVKKYFSGKDALWIASLMSNTDAPCKGEYTNFVLDNIEDVYEDYAHRPMSKDRYVVYGTDLARVYWDEDRHQYITRFDTMDKNANTSNGCHRTLEKLGVSIVTLDTTDAPGATKSECERNQRVYNAIARYGLLVVDNDNVPVDLFITAQHGASDQRNGKVGLMSTTVPTNSPMYKLNKDGKRAYLYKALLNHEKDPRQLVEVMDELGIGSAELAKMMARICVDTAGSILISEAVPEFKELLHSAKILCLTEDKNIDIEVRVVDCDDNYKVTIEKRQESACNGEGAMDTIYFVPASVACGHMTLSEGEKFVAIYERNGRSVKRSMKDRKDGKTFRKLYKKLRKVVQFRMFHDGKKGLLVEVCVNDFLEWYKNSDKPNMRRAYETLKDYDVWCPKELVKFNTNQSLDSLEVLCTEKDTRGYAMMNHQFAETYPIDLSPYVVKYFKMLKDICGEDAETAAEAALKFLNVLGDMALDPDSDGDVSMNPYDLAKRIASNHMLVQEPNTRKEIFHLREKFLQGLGIGKIPVPKAGYVLGIVDFAGYIDILFDCEEKNPDALKGDEVYFNGMEGNCVMNGAPTTGIDEVQVGKGVKSAANKDKRNILIFSAYSGFAFKMSNHDVDGDNYFVMFDVDDMTHAIIEAVKSIHDYTTVCDARNLFETSSQSFKGPFANDAEFMTVYKKFIVVTRNSSKVGIINDAFERIVSMRQHLEFLLGKAKKLGATFEFINRYPLVPKGKTNIVDCLYRASSKVIVATHLIRNFDKDGNPNFFLDGSCTIEDVEKVLTELRNMERLATAAMQQEVDSAKKTGLSVKDEIIQYLSIASTPAHMCSRSMYKGKNCKAIGSGDGNKYQGYYTSASCLGKLNTTVNNFITKMNDEGLMVQNARHLGMDMLPLLTSEERDEIAAVKDKIVELRKEYSARMHDVFAKLDVDPFAEVEKVSQINADIIASVQNIADKDGVSISSLAATMFLQMQLSAAVKTNEDGTRFKGYNFGWLFADAVTRIFARDTSKAIVSIEIDPKYYGKTLTMESNWLYDDEGNKVVKVPSAPNSKLTYVPEVTAYGDVVVFAKKDNGYALGCEDPIQEVEMPVYHCDHKFQEWKAIRKAGGDILVNVEISDDTVVLKMVGEKTSENSGVIYHTNSNWKRILTATQMVGHTYKVMPTAARDGRAYVLKLTLVK